MVAPARLMTVQAFERWIESPEAQGRWVELIHGIPVEKMPNQEHGQIADNLYRPLTNFVHAQKLGRLVFEVLYKAPADPHNVRQPDIAFTSRDHLLPLTKRGAAPLIPDLCIEIKSPGNSIPQLREKAEYYLNNGGRMVWLIYPGQKIIEVYTADDVIILTESDTLTGGDVIPGFTLPLTEVFAEGM